MHYCLFIKNKHCFLAVRVMGETGGTVSYHESILAHGLDYITGLQFQ